MKIILIVAALSGMLMPATASAELDYNTVDVGYSTTSYSDSTLTRTELNFGYANSISENAYLQAAYRMGTLSTYGGSDRNLRSISVGAGYHTPLKDDVDALAQGNLVLGTSRSSGDSASANGYDIGAGVRALFRSGLEGTLMVVHASTSNGIHMNTDTFLGARFGYNFTAAIQMYAGIDLRTELTSTMGLRFFY